MAFRWKDYRVSGSDRWKTMRFQPHEFIRRFLLHVLPKGFHRIRHYGLFASTNRAESIAMARALFNVALPAADDPRCCRRPKTCTDQDIVSLAQRPKRWDSEAAKLRRLRCYKFGR
jgi:hypothetical protein